jgi:hypothetical protein
MRSMNPENRQRKKAGLWKARPKYALEGKRIPISMAEPPTRPPCLKAAPFDVTAVTGKKKLLQINPG